MKQRVVRVDPLSAARVVALLYFIIGVIALPFLYLGFVVTPTGLGFSPGLVFLEPFLLSGIGFASTALACALFNSLAGRFGGLEIDLRDVESG